MTERKRRILVVEDDVSILSGISMNLRYEGYEVLQAQDGRRALELILEAEPDLVVLDVMLPQMNGFEVLTELRRRNVSVPVIVLSAKGLEQDKILGLGLGADDYVAKPFGLQELLARIQAVLRRRARERANVKFGECEVDFLGKQVRRNGNVVDLTAQEFRLLEHLVAHASRTFSRDELLLAAWDVDYEGSVRTVDNFMRQLRTKLETSPDAPRHFVTVRGMGYRFDP
ncbi:MAG: response regulator transcription factor [Myxococcaceae bacterium]